VDVLDLQSYGKTLVLQARNQLVSYDKTGGPIPLAVTPKGARAVIRGRILGAAGAYAMLGIVPSAFQGNPAIGNYLSEVEVVGVGQPFHWELNCDQTLYGMASVDTKVPWGGPGQLVWASFSVVYIELEAYLAGGPDGTSGRTGLAGPPLGWRKG
jgi:hypothetical protein